MFFFTTSNIMISNTTRRIGLLGKRKYFKLPALVHAADKDKRTCHCHMWHILVSCHALCEQASDHEDKR